jgi:cytohesin
MKRLVSAVRCIFAQLCVCIATFAAEDGAFAARNADPMVGSSPSLDAVIQRRENDPVRLKLLKEEFVAAITQTNVLTAKRLLKLFPDLAEVTDKSGQPVLVTAAAMVNPELVEALLEAGAYVDRCAPYGATALATAGAPLHSRQYVFVSGPGLQLPQMDLTNCLLIVRTLLKHDAYIFLNDQYEQSILQRSLYSSDGRLLDALLTECSEKGSCNADQITPLHYAVLWGRTNALKILAQREGATEAINKDGFTPLQLAARFPRPREGLPFFLISFGHEGLDYQGPPLQQQTARLLIDAGANLDFLSTIGLGWTNEFDAMLREYPTNAFASDAQGQTALHWAAEFGRDYMARRLLQAGVAVDRADAKGLNPLDLAAEKGFSTVAKLLIQHGAAPSRRTGVTGPVHWAADQWDTALVDALYYAGTNLEAEDALGRTPFEVAAQRGCEPIARSLIRRHARVRFRPGTTTPLHWAAQNGQTNLIALYLELGANINAPNADGNTPIHIAHGAKRFDVLEFLLANGADINARDRGGNSILHLAAAAPEDRFQVPTRPPGRFSVAITKLLANPAAKRFLPGSITAPKPATRSMMGFILDHHGDVNARNHDGETPLHCVSGKQFGGTNAVADACQWIEPLLRKGASVTAPNVWGGTPLHAALRSRGNPNEPLVKALLKSGASLENGDRSGGTPLHQAVRSNDATAVRFLLNLGANPNSRDSIGRTPLHVAAHNDGLEFSGGELVTLLIAYGSEIDAVDNHGSTPLHLACSRRRIFGGSSGSSMALPGQKESQGYWFAREGKNPMENETIPCILMARGSNVRLCDPAGDSALHLAARAGRVKLIEILKARGFVANGPNRLGQTPLQVMYESDSGGCWLSSLLPACDQGEITDAARFGDLQTVKAYLDYDSRFANWKGLLGATPLHWACNEGKMEVVKLLLDRGASPDPTIRPINRASFLRELNGMYNTLESEERRRVAVMPVKTTGPPPGEDRVDLHPNATPLQLALAGGHQDIAALLVKRCAKVDPVSAAILGRDDLLEGFLKSDPSIVAQTYHRYRWYMACTKRGIEVRQYCYPESGALLHFAAKAGRSSTVELLLKYGASPGVVDDSGERPEKVAEAKGHRETADLLRLAGERRR